ncbi:UDP-glucose/GDP-mannose dehydrogenase family protein [Amycolatopsis sp. FDAARGOS 1241]|uniref:UDP-glucose dehydrogenase family protein n=1 Tax=Amycolatopsis sp. FDAARGOS 1241 TaxID=2778070 RepID=UPI0019513D73|nr:UDP-glucose/GDP-mannose dehydrogenase family protein [Amycolatopsis sp. FDAARGOS 1241]QRP49716.1 UDP-glucose/GDP-mannose dehydrogenase family protein [Amycolatopsis sp. FDAARGOS 1241]
MGEHVGVVGAGYVGLTSAACFAHLGHRVTCVDIDESKVDNLARAEVPISEPGLPELVAEGLADGTLAFTADDTALAECGIVLLCLPTPPDHEGKPDLGVLEDVVPRLGRLLAPGAVVATKSTVPVGTAARLPDLLRRTDLSVVSNPEFLREGHCVDDFLRPGRVVVGTDPPGSEAARRIERLYDPTRAPVVRADTASAELAKYASNAFLAVKLSYVNVLAELCERFGADVGEVARTMGLDSRIGPEFLAPGPGWGGSCLPKDTTALLHAAGSAGVDFGILRDAVRVNARQRARAVRTVREAVTGSPWGALSGARIGVLGLAFKAGTGDLRDSPALAIATELARRGAEVTAHDPAVGPGPGLDALQVVDDPYLVAKDAAALVVLTEWPEFRDLDWARLAAATARPVVVDTRNLLDSGQLAEAGFTHLPVGRRHPDAAPFG